MHIYVEFVENYPLLSAIIQFAILGTLGEVISRKMAHQRVFGFFVALEKAIVWSLLAIMIKYAFVGFFGFTHALVSSHLLPSVVDTNIFARAFAVSSFTNLIFGPIMIYSHRFLDNFFMRKHNYSNMKGAIWTLVWFWIPAHTVTFSLPVNYQIGLAALWSIVLGIILGYFGSKKVVEA
jgi:hypothetical protein